jgi:hypothetical protein
MEVSPGSQSDSKAWTTSPKEVQSVWIHTFVFVRIRMVANEVKKWVGEKVNRQGSTPGITPLHCRHRVQVVTEAGGGDTWLPSSLLLSSRQMDDRT